MTFEPFSLPQWRRQSSCVPRWLSRGLTPSRVSCLTQCWMCECDWTGWRNFSGTFYVSARKPSDSIPSWLSPMSRRGTKRRSGPGNRVSVTSTPVRESVQRLRISKYLTCDELRERLTMTPVAAMRRWSSYDFGIGGSRIFARTLSRSSRLASLSPLWTGERDPVDDLIEFQRRMRERFADPVVRDWGRR